MSEMTTTIGANACNKCGLAIEPLSADPGLWAVWICLPGDNGVNKPYHNKCILGPIDELDRLRQENEQLKLGIEELNTLRLNESRQRFALGEINAIARDCGDLGGHAENIKRIIKDAAPITTDKGEKL